MLDKEVPQLQEAHLLDKVTKVMVRPLEAMTIDLGNIPIDLVQIEISIIHL